MSDAFCVVCGLELEEPGDIWIESGSGPVCEACVEALRPAALAGTTEVGACCLCDGVRIHCSPKRLRRLELVTFETAAVCRSCIEGLAEVLAERTKTS